MNRIAIVGIGPGALEYIAPAAMKAIEACDLLVGGRRNLQSLSHFKKRELIYESNLSELIDRVSELRMDYEICVVVSGDPGFYSLLDVFLRRFKSEDLIVIPGLSSFQYLFSKLSRPWKSYELISLHGRPINTHDFERGRGYFILTDGTNTPSSIARYLIETETPNRVMIIGENLSYPNERILFGNPLEFRDKKFDKLCVVVIENEVEI